MYGEKLIGLLKPGAVGPIRAEATGRQRCRERPKALIRRVCSSRPVAEVYIFSNVNIIIVNCLRNESTANHVHKHPTLTNSVSPLDVASFGS